MSGVGFRRSWLRPPRATVVPFEAGEEFRHGGRVAAQTSPASGRRPFDRARFDLLLERIGRAAIRAGWPGGVGAVLLVFAAVFGHLSGVALEERRAALAAERAGLLRGEVREAPAVSERERLQAFYARFPPVAALPERLRRLDDYAAAHGLRLQRTDYRSATEAGTPLLQIALAIPVRGDFDALYGWLAEMLREMPEVALESLSVKRAATDTPIVEADVRLQLYLRGRP